MHVYVAWMILSHQKKVKVRVLNWNHVLWFPPICKLSSVERIKSKLFYSSESRKVLWPLFKCLVNSSPLSFQLMQADPHKLDFRSDLLARLPGAGGLGPLGPIGGALPPTHDLTRPPSQSVFPLGPVNPSSAPFISPSTPHSSFLAPTAHLGKSVSKRHIHIAPLRFTHSRSFSTT